MTGKSTMSSPAFIKLNFVTYCPRSKILLKQLFIKKHMVTIYSWTINLNKAYFSNITAFKVIDYLPIR